MTANEHTHDSIGPEINSREYRNGEIIPLQRCPHLYIKHTAAKGKHILLLQSTEINQSCSPSRRSDKPVTKSKHALQTDPHLGDENVFCEETI
jgi:hypothetical protein